MQPTRRRGPVRGFFTGVGYLLKGLRMWGTNRRLFWLGTIPAVIAGLLYLAIVIVFAINFENIVRWITIFAEDWVEPWRLIVRIAAGIGLILVGLLLIVDTYTTVTLAIGDPFYERIWRRVEGQLGNPAPESSESFWRAFFRSLGNALRLLGRTVLIAMVVAIVSIIPFVGGVLAAVLGAVLGGWLLAVEFAGFTFDARHMTLKQRRRMLGTRRAETLGFGVATYLMFLLPLGAVFTMPAAVAGATMLSRAILDDDAAAPLVVNPVLPALDS